MNTPSFVSWATSPHQPHQTAIRKSAVKRKLSCSGVRGQQGVFKPFLRMETRPNAWGGLKRKYQNFTVNDWKKKCPIHWWILVKVTVKPFGGNIHVWGCLFLIWSWTPAQNWLDPDQWDVPLHPSETDTPTGLHLCEDRFLQQQDNDSKHTSDLVKDSIKFKTNAKIEVFSLVAWLSDSAAGRRMFNELMMAFWNNWISFGCVFLIVLNSICQRIWFTDALLKYFLQM